MDGPSGLSRFDDFELEHVRDFFHLELAYFWSSLVWNGEHGWRIFWQYLDSMLAHTHFAQVSSQRDSRSDNIFRIRYDFMCIHVFIGYKLVRLTIQIFFRAFRLCTIIHIHCILWHSFYLNTRTACVRVIFLLLLLIWSFLLRAHPVLQNLRRIRHDQIFDEENRLFREV